jgi:hypothetical protein
MPLKYSNMKFIIKPLRFLNPICNKKINENFIMQYYSIYLINRIIGYHVFFCILKKVSEFSGIYGFFDELPFEFCFKLIIFSFLNIGMI